MRYREGILLKFIKEKLTILPDIRILFLLFTVLIMYTTLVIFHASIRNSHSLDPGLEGIIKGWRRDNVRQLLGERTTYNIDIPTQAENNLFLYSTAESAINLLSPLVPPISTPPPPIPPPGLPPTPIPIPLPIPAPKPLLWNS
jgi:hypothetical protein